MKEGFSDILYLLAMVAFFIFSAVMKSRKAKKNLPPQPKADDYDPWESEQEEDTSTVFEDVFKTQEDLTTETLAAQEAAERSRDLVKEQEWIAKQAIVAKQTARKFEDIQKTKIYKESQFKYSKVDSTNDSGSFWDEEEFDLKRAIVFSEILKRPEL